MARPRYVTPEARYVPRVAQVKEEAVEKQPVKEPVHRMVETPVHKNKRPEQVICYGYFFG